MNQQCVGRKRIVLVCAATGWAPIVKLSRDTKTMQYENRQGTARIKYCRDLDNKRQDGVLMGLFVGLDERVSQRCEKLKLLTCYWQEKIEILHNLYTTTRMATIVSQRVHRNWILNYMLIFSKCFLLFRSIV